MRRRAFVRFSTPQVAVVGPEAGNEPFVGVDRRADERHEFGQGALLSGEIVASDGRAAVLAIGLREGVRAGCGVCQALMDMPAAARLLLAPFRHERDEQAALRRRTP